MVLVVVIVIVSDIEGIIIWFKSWCTSLSLSSRHYPVLIISNHTINVIVFAWILSIVIVV